MRSTCLALLALAAASVAHAAPLTCLETMNRLQASVDAETLQSLQSLTRSRDDGSTGKQFAWSLPSGMELTFNCTTTKGIWALEIYRGATAPLATYRAMSAKALCAVTPGWSAAECQGVVDRIAARADLRQAHKVYADLPAGRYVDYSNWPDSQGFAVMANDSPHEMTSDATPVALTWVDGNDKPIP